MSRGPGPRDPRQARHRDRDEQVYARRRREDARRRAALERRTYDPAPPGDEDWTAPDPDSDGLQRVQPPSSVAAALEGFVARQGWGDRLRGARVFERWESIVGAALAARCEPVRVAGGTLVIRAESQVWATQLHYLTPHLLRSTTEVLGQGTVRDIRVVVGPLTGTQENP